MFRAIIVIISILSALPAGLARGSGGDSIQITVENKSASPVLLQVRDEVCNTPVSDACTQADFINKSMECRKTSLLDACIQAQQKLEGGSCVEGLVYERNVAVSEKISLSICANPSGYGRVSMRDLSRNTIWKTSIMVSNGDSLSYP
jgi:hypothetical protein